MYNIYILHIIYIIYNILYIIIYKIYITYKQLHRYIYICIKYNFLCICIYIYIYILTTIPLYVQKLKTTVGYTCIRARHASRGANKLKFYSRITRFIITRPGWAFSSVVRATSPISLSMRDQSNVCACCDDCD